MIKLRAKTFQLYRRVPRRYSSVEPRQFVWVSLHTDSPSVAKSKAEGAWAQMIEAWEAKLAGDTSDAESRFAAARDLAASRGFRYLKAADVARLPTEELLDRVESVSVRKGAPDPIEARALLGGAPEPPITVSRALELYWTLAADRTHGKSPDQLRRWKNPRKKAVANFIDVVGDKALAEISGDDMLDFRQWWIERIDEEDLTANSANKDLIHLGDILKTVNRMKRLGLVLPLSDLSLKEGDAKKRPPFSDSWIREKILADGALDGLNAEARCILLGMINTGGRPSEIANLQPRRIRLDDPVPHIVIEADDRQVKTKHARRTIPLTGVSLEALRRCPDGFPRYRDKAGLSDTINKFLRENGLMESEHHVLYSLRHSFEDRMLAAGVDDRIRRDLLGHRLSRERYGAGASLEQARRILQAFAL